MKYKFNSRIRYSEIGENRKLTMPALINYFQDCSNFHSEEVNRGIDWLKERNKAWILAAWQIHVERYPLMGEEVKISTWAYGFKGFQGLRNFTMESEAGEMLAYANSVWVFINLETGAPERVCVADFDVYGPEQMLEAEFGPRKITVPNTESIAYEPFQVMEYHLDTNHHVNNGQYIQIAQGYVPADFEVHDMRAEYKSQARLGDSFYPVSCQNSQGFVVALHNEQGQPYAVVEFK